MIVRPTVDNEVVNVAKVRGELKELRGERHGQAS